MMCVSLIRGDNWRLEKIKRIVSYCMNWSDDEY